MRRPPPKKDDKVECHPCGWLFFMFLHPGLYLVTRLLDVRLPPALRNRFRRRKPNEVIHDDEDDTLTFTNRDQTKSIFCWALFLTLILWGFIFVIVLRKFDVINWEKQWLPHAIFFSVFLFLPIGYYMFRKRTDADFWTVDREPKIRFYFKDFMKGATIVIEFFQLSSFSFRSGVGWGRPSVSDVFSKVSNAINLDISYIGISYQIAVVAVLLFACAEVLFYSSVRYVNGGDIRYWRTFNDFILDTGFLTITSSLASVLRANYLNTDRTSMIYSLVTLFLLVSYFSCCFGVLAGRADQKVDRIQRRERKEHYIYYMPGFEILEKALKAVLVVIISFLENNILLYLCFLCPINLALASMVWLIVPASHFSVNVVRGGTLTVCFLSTVGALVTQIYKGTTAQEQTARDAVWYAFLGSCGVVFIAVLTLLINQWRGAPCCAKRRIFHLFAPDRIVLDDNEAKKLKPPPRPKEVTELHNLCPPMHAPAPAPAPVHAPAPVKAPAPPHAPAPAHHAPAPAHHGDAQPHANGHGGQHYAPVPVHAPQHDEFAPVVIHRAAPTFVED